MPTTLLLPSTLNVVFFYPQLKKLTGAQRLIVMLARYSARAGARVTILTHRAAPPVREAIGDGVTLIETGARIDRFGDHFADAALEYLAGPALLRAVPGRPDAIVFFGPPSLPALWVARWRNRGVARIYFCFEPPRAAYSDRRAIARRAGILAPLVSALALGYRSIDRHFARSAGALCANGEYGRGLIRRAYGIEATVITHGVDLPPAPPSAAASIRERWKIPPGEPVVLTVNQLHPRKRIDLLIRAVSILRDEGAAVHLLIVGEGVARRELERLRRELRLEKLVTLCGFVPDDMLMAYYTASTVYAHTGLAESFGLSVLEAAASGLPVVAVAEGGPLETVAHERTGLLVDPTPLAIATALSRMRADPDAAREMGQRASDDVRARYRWEDGAARLLESIAGAVARN